MAIHANSTTAPARPLLRLRDPDGRFARRAEARPELPAEPLLADSAEAVRADLDALLACHGGAPRRGDIPTTPEPPTAPAARALHLRRQLAAAVEHGTDLLAALGLPRLVGPGFAPIDVRAAGDAIEAAVAALDALDGDPEAEDGGDDEDDRAELEGWLGWGPGSQLHLTTNTDDGFDPLDRGELMNEDGDDLDRGEHDTADAEPSLGWPNDHTAVLSDAPQWDVDAERDDADLEDADEDDDHREPWPSPRADRAQVAHV